LADAFWTLSNLVCAFAVAQMIAYMMAAGGKDSVIVGGVKLHYIAISIAIVIATAGYGKALHYFAACHWTLLKVDDATRKMLWWTSVARTLVMAAINGVGLVVTLDISGKL
jgi:hypothetical protein